MIKKLIQKRRAVSPILAAILLIGLAVTAGAIIIVFVLPMLEGASNVEFVEAEADDRNLDGLLDKITVTVSNKGTLVDTLAEGTLTSGGITWTTAGNVEIPLANPVELEFLTTDVNEQLDESATVSLTLTFDSSEAITITDANIDMDQAAVLTNSDYIGDASDWIRSTTAGGAAIVTTDAAIATHSGDAGVHIQIDTDGDNYFYPTPSLTDPTAFFTGTKSEITTFDHETTPVISFWVKMDGEMSTGDEWDGSNFYLYLVGFSGQSETTQNVYYQLDNNFLATTYTQNSWVRVVIEVGDFTGVANLDSADSVGFGFRLDNNGDGNNWDVYIDDFSVHDGLA